MVSVHIYQVPAAAYTVQYRYRGCRKWNIYITLDSEDAKSSLLLMALRAMGECLLMDNVKRVRVLAIPPDSDPCPEPRLVAEAVRK